MTERVLVTGISGYIGQHIAAELLRSGYEVIGTVRSRMKTESTAAAIAAVAPADRLSFAETDLLSDSGWDDAMSGCTYVMHVASPFILTEPKDENDVIAPAVSGTVRVIEAAQRAGVARLVLTSSTFAMVAGRSNGRYGPDSWSDTTANIGAYAKSKTLAERAAWEAVQGGGMELSVINPGGVSGPPLDPELTSSSVSMMSDMIGGKMPMLPDIALNVVDVRDVAKLHVKAMTTPLAAGQRFIAATSDPVPYTELAEILKQAGYSQVSTRKAPTVLLKAMGLFSREARGAVPMLGKRTTLDTTTTSEVLDWHATPMKTSFLDMAASLSTQGTDEQRISA
jgi:dihydroflavonol-4-reductase